MTSRRLFLRQAALAAGGLVAARSGVSGASLHDASRGGAPLRILLLGGTGFLGPHLVHVAKQRGHQLTMLNRGRREPTMFEEDFRDVVEIQGDRAQPTGLDGLKGKTWDVVIETSGYRHPWTQESARALKGSVGRYMYVSSTGVYWPYHTTNIAENGRVLLKDDPPVAQPTYGVMKGLSENEVRDAFGNNAIVVRPGYIVGPGDTSDRWTYWPMRIVRGGEVAVPGKRTDPVQYVDVRDLAEFMIGLIDSGTNGTFNVVGPARRQSMQDFVQGVAAIATAPLSWTWIDDYEFLKKYPLRRAADGTASGLFEAIPWVMVDGDELGHMQIDASKAVQAGLKYRPLATTARDTVAWRNSPAVPQALRDQPRYVMSPADEEALLRAWKSRT